MPTICLQNAYKMPTICLQNAYKMPTICLQYVYKMPTICLQYAYNMLIKCLQYAYNMPTICLQYTYKMPTIYLQYTYKMPTLDVNYKLNYLDFINPFYISLFIIITLQFSFSNCLINITDRDSRRSSEFSLKDIPKIEIVFPSSFLYRFFKIDNIWSDCFSFTFFTLFKSIG